MKKLIQRILIVSLIASPTLAFSQQGEIGAWTEHLPYQKGTSIASTGSIVFCGTTTGLFSYNTNDNSISRYSKVNILNGVSVAALAYSEEYQLLVVGYLDANIDLIQNGRAFNLPFIKNSSVNQKLINEIDIVGDRAYLAMGFGIVVIDIVKREIVDTYKFGSGGSDIKVNSTFVNEQFIYAATDKGLYKASLQSNLLDFNSWQKLSFKENNKFVKLAKINNDFLCIVDEKNVADSVFLHSGGNNFINQQQLSGGEYISFNLTVNDQLVLNYLDKTIIADRQLNLINTFPLNNVITVAAEMTSSGRLFLLDGYNPLLEFDPSAGTAMQSIRPNGPFEKDIFDIKASNGVVWAAAGAHNTAYSNAYRGGRIYKYEQGNWQSYIDFSTPSLAGKFDILSVTMNPEDEQDVYFGTWGRGLIRHHDALPFITYDTSNSELKIRQALSSDKWIGTGEGAFDDDGNFWTTNTFNVNALAVRKKNGKWRSFNFSNLINNDETAIYDIVISDEGYKWITLPRENEIIVFDDNGTIDDISDDRSILLSEQEGFGNIPGSRGIKIEKDKDGLIWIGTSEGISVHFNPAQVFESGFRDFERIIFFDGENNEIVLGSTPIKEITIDGKNRKWIGTETSGVIVLSPDGKETIYEFNAENSPLLSNSINAIGIDDITGEVYIATDEGLLSYRSDATAGGESFSDVKVFPNPVRESHQGPIIVQGLIDNSTLKITDVNGTLVQQLTTEGGTATWDGRNFSGDRVSTGVYLLFYSAEDEEGDLKTEVGKILFIH